MNCKGILGLTVIGLSVVLGGIAIAAQTPSPFLLVLEKGTNTIAFVDPTTLQVLARAPSGPDPHEVIASSDGTCAYISNYGGEGSSMNTISVVDLIARKALPPINLGALNSVHGLDFAGGKLYFTAETNKVIGRYDPATQHVDWILGTGQDRTHMIGVSKDLSHIFTANVSSATISIIEEVTQPVRSFGPPPGRDGGSTGPPPPGSPRRPRKVWEVTNVPAGRGSEGFDVSPDGQEIWAVSGLDGTVTVIDVASKKVIQTLPIPVEGANRLKFTLDGRFVLVSGLGGFQTSSSGGNNLVVLDAGTRKVVKQLDLGGGSAGILMDPSGARAYVAVNQGNRVAVIDVQTWQVSSQVFDLSQPDALAWAPKKSRSR